MFAPFGVAPANQTAVWKPSPTFRGTYDIFSSCLVTMALCIWTAVHLNIPEHKKSSQQKWRKLGWLMMGLFAPEMVAWTAYQQHKDARQLAVEMKALFGEVTSTSTRGTSVWRRILKWKHKTKADEENPSAQSDSSSSPKRRPWTIVHSHYALMGGYVMATSETEPRFLPEGRTRLVLTVDGIRLLATIDSSLVPDISQAQIEDKSKAGNLGKTLVCVQASWFCIQCLSRLGQQLQISLLEVNTFAHAICTLLIYFMWWSKPQDIEEPSLIVGQKADTLTALMYMNSKIGHPPDPATAGTVPAGAVSLRYNYFLRHSSSAVKYSDLAWRFTSGTTSYLNDVTSLVDDRAHGNEAERSSVKIRNPGKIDKLFRLYPNQTLYGFGFGPRVSGLTQLRDLKDIVGSTGILGFKPAPLDLNNADVRCWELAAEGLRYYHSPTSNGLSPYKLAKSPQKPGYKFQDSPGDSEVQWKNMVCDQAFGGDYVTDRARMIRGDFEVTDRTRMLRGDFEVLTSGGYKRMLLGLTLAGVWYGGLHVLAWQAPFSTQAQEKLWRICSVVLASSGFLATVSFYLVILLVYVDETMNSASSIFRAFGQLGWWPHILCMGLILLSYCLLYVFARVYLVVECFINLAHLPEGVYEVSSWSQYVPHIT